MHDIVSLKSGAPHGDDEVEAQAENEPGEDESGEGDVGQVGTAHVVPPLGHCNRRGQSGERFERLAEMRRKKKKLKEEEEAQW